MGIGPTTLHTESNEAMQDEWPNIKDFYKGKFRKNLNLSRNLYGNGNSSKKVIKILKHINFKKLLNKKFVDIKI